MNENLMLIGFQAGVLCRPTYSLQCHRFIFCHCKSHVTYMCMLCITHLQSLIEVPTVIIDGKEASIAPAEGDLIAAIIPPVVVVSTCTRGI